MRIASLLVLCLGLFVASQADAQAPATPNVAITTVRDKGTVTVTITGMENPRVVFPDDSNPQVLVKKKTMIVTATAEDTKITVVRGPEQAITVSKFMAGAKGRRVMCSIEIRVPQTYAVLINGNKGP